MGNQHQTAVEEETCSHPKFATFQADGTGPAQHRPQCLEYAKDKGSAADGQQLTRQPGGNLRKRLSNPIA